MIQTNTVIRPLYLIPEENVEVKYSDTFEEVACVHQESTMNGKRYIIQINKRKAREMFNKSWLKIGPRKFYVDFNTFLTGLLLHEVSHIKYKAFEIEPPVKNGVFHSIWNILLDNQGEYSLTMDHPSVSMYIQFILSVLKINANMHSNTKEAELVQNLLGDLFYLARFGIIRNEADTDFIDFSFPFILAATRQDYKTVMFATKLIYQYIYTKVNPEAQKLIRHSTHEMMTISTSDLKEAQQGDKIAGSTVLNAAKRIVQGKSDLGAGKNDRKIEINEKDTAFYRTTVEKYPELIERLRRAFKLRLDTISKVAATDGDFNIHRQMSAYVASFTGETSYDYTVMKRLTSALDVIFIRDISGSTNSVSQKYAELTVCLLAAVSNLNGIRVGQIDFSDSSVVNLNFDEAVSQSRVHPEAEGGTYVSSAYHDAIAKFSYQSRRIWIVLTDGGFSDAPEAAAIEKAVAEQGIEVGKFFIGNPHYADSASVRKMILTTFDTFPEDVSEWLLRKLV